MELKNKSLGWQKYWDDESKTPFAVNGDKVITYDDERSLTEKVRFAMEKKLAGIMVWSLDTDDFQGDCTEDSMEHYTNFPLMRTINKAIEQSLLDLERNKENEIEHGNVNETNDSLIVKPVGFIFTVTSLYFLMRYCI